MVKTKLCHCAYHPHICKPLNESLARTGLHLQYHMNYGAEYMCSRYIFTASTQYPWVLLVVWFWYIYIWCYCHSASLCYLKLRCRCVNIHLLHHSHLCYICLWLPLHNLLSILPFPPSPTPTPTAADGGTTGSTSHNMYEALPICMV